MLPARLRVPDRRIARKVRHHLPEEARRRHKIRVEDGDELAARRPQAVGQRAGFVAAAMRAVDQRDVDAAPAMQLDPRPRQRRRVIRRVVQDLDLQPIVDLGMRLGEGTGAAVALPVVRAAVAALATMATFDDAGVSGRSTPWSPRWTNPSRRQPWRTGA